MGLFPLLLAALLIWVGVFAFIFGVDRRVAALERRVDNLPPTGDDTESARRAKEELG